MEEDSEDAEDNESGQSDVSMKDAGDKNKSNLSSMVRDKEAVDVLEKTGGQVDPNSDT